ncbi:hypothetical protein H072_7712 [Dactylellina haptotyla CBS 200.50]|uniref:Nucleotide exchange factor SIL1 n=1 Tax=Dactylellina haptotyla (strain CBS 200.50) TaxID=1284197 RepID=S8BTJ6_DACHA|nr:hypothetical protein H072_7712 [Dactylellina haptotyla CBS 200.50]
MNRLNRLAVFAIWLLCSCLLLHGAFATPSDTNVESPEGEPVEMICHPEKECYPKIFVPTTTFLPVHEDQVIPPGLHVRLNIGTGGREAKLIDPNEDDGTAVYVEKNKKAELPPPVMEYSDLVVVPDQDIDQASALTGGRGNETEVPGSSHQPAQEIHHDQKEPENLKPNPHLSSSDWEDFNNAVDVLKGAYPTSRTLPSALTKLVDLSHEPEYGVKLIEQCLHHLIKILSSETYTSQIRSSAAITLGNSLQNNAVALKRVKKLLGKDTKDIVFRPLVEVLTGNTEVILGRRLMFALSRTVRIHHGKEEFIAVGGLEALKKVYSATPDLPLRGKIAAFLQDEFLDMDMIKPEIAKSGGANGKQKVLKGTEDLSGWCDILQDDLIKREKAADPDSEVKVLVTLTALRAKYGKDCKAKEDLKGWLTRELERIQKEEEDSDWIKVPLDDVDSGFFGSSA